jgi:hypothetical protein
MNEYPIITQMLRTVFNSEDGLSYDVAIRLYKRATENSGQTAALTVELKKAFDDLSLSWKKVLLNDDYEVFDAQSEAEAREYARRILWIPILGEKK